MRLGHAFAIGSSAVRILAQASDAHLRKSLQRISSLAKGTDKRMPGWVMMSVDELRSVGERFEVVRDGRNEVEFLPRVISFAVIDVVDEIQFITINAKLASQACSTASNNPTGRPT